MTRSPISSEVSLLSRYFQKHQSYLNERLNASAFRGNRDALLISASQLHELTRDLTLFLQQVTDKHNTVLHQHVDIDFVIMQVYRQERLLISITEEQLQSQQISPDDFKLIEGFLDFKHRIIARLKATQYEISQLETYLYVDKPERMRREVLTQATTVNNNDMLSANKRNASAAVTLAKNEVSDDIELKFVIYLFIQFLSYNYTDPESLNHEELVEYFMHFRKLHHFDTRSCLLVRLNDQITRTRPAVNQQDRETAKENYRYHASASRDANIALHLYAQLLQLRTLITNKSRIRKSLYKVFLPGLSSGRSTAAAAHPDRDNVNVAPPSRMYDSVQRQLAGPYKNIVAATVASTSKR